MLTWEECAALTRLLPEELSALDTRMPMPEFMVMLMEPYVVEAPLKDRPGVRVAIRDDIAAAQRRGSYDFSLILKLALRARLQSQGYAGKIPEIPQKCA